MKKFLVLGAVGVFLFLNIFSAQAEECATSTAKGKIVLNEISSASTHDDWIEIYNLFDKCIDLTGFSISDSTGEIKSFTTGTILAPQNFLLVDLNNRLNKAADSVIFKNNDEEWDRFDYGSEVAYIALNDNEFWARIPDGGDWMITNTSTPGVANILFLTTTITTTDSNTTTVTSTTIASSTEDTTFTTTSTSSSVVFDLSGLRLNEVFSDPNDGNEWVEIYNGGSTTDFFDLKICDNRVTACKSASGTIANASWFLFNLGSGFLNNDGDSAILKDAQDNILDQTDFGVIGKGRSWARTIDGVGEWKITTEPTPNEANKIVEPVVSNGGASGGLKTVNMSYENLTPNKATPPATSSFFGKIVLNEILPDPEGSDLEEEFIEIKNISTETVSLSGWSIGDKDKKYFLANANVISPGEILFWKRNNTGVVLNNTSAEEVLIWDNLGDIVDKIKYEHAKTGLSFARFADGWFWTTNVTPGKENILEEDDEVGIIWKIKYPFSGAPNEALSFSAEESVDPRGGNIQYIWNFDGLTTTTGERVDYVFVTSGVHIVDIFASSTMGTTGQKQIKITIGDGLSVVNSSILISEIMFDPIDSETREYIELWNNSSSTIDLSGWQLRVGNKKYQIPDKTIILPNSTLVFYRAATKISLNNTGGKVELLTPGDTVVDVVKYGKGVSGKSYSFVNGQWLLANPTPGSISDVVDATNSVYATNVIKNKNIWFKKFSLGDVREQEKGVSVWVQGVVTALPGVFGAQYFYISDETGGIAVYQYKKDFPPLKVGDKVEVKGVISEANGQKRINIKQAKAVNILRIEEPMQDIAIDLVDLENVPLGSLVKVVGDITEKKSRYWYIDDGAAEAMVYFKQGAKIDVTSFQEGQKVEVVGILEQGKNSLQIWPRDNYDLKIIGQAKELAVATTDNKINYFSAAVGAVAALFLGFITRVRGAGIISLAVRGGKAIASIIRRG